MTRIRRTTAARVSFALLAMGGVSLPTLAAAAPIAAADPRDEAKTLSLRAATAFKLAHFQEALDLYTQAYERFPAPALLFNLGQCNKNLGHHERAIFFFQGYLRDKPDAPNRGAVESLLADSKKLLAAERAAESSAAAEKRRLEELAAEKLAADARTAEEVARSQANVTGPLPAAPPREMHRRPAWMIGGAISAGVGLVLLGTGMYFGLHANSEASQLSQLSTSGGTWSSHYQSVYDSGQSAAHAATGLFVAGGILFGGGVTVVLLGAQKHAVASSVTVGLAPGAGGSSLLLTGRF